MKEQENIMIGGTKPLIDCLYDLQNIYKFDITVVAKTGKIELDIK